MTTHGKLHRRSETYGKVPEYLMHDLSVTDGAVRLYSHLHWRYGLNEEVYESQKSIGEKLGVSEKTINNRVRELEKNDWVIVIEREFNSETGNYQSNFYHVFELQADCRKFRKSYVAEEGEVIRSKPQKARQRKARTGIGGSPNHQNSSSDGHHRNSSSDGLRNSSSDNTESSYIDSIRITESISNESLSAANAAHTDSFEKSSLTFNQEEKPKSNQQILVETVAYHIFDTVVDKIKENNVGGRSGKIAAWLNGTSAPAGMSKISKPASPEHVEMFVKWWKENKNGISLPRDPVKFVESWREWASSFKIVKTKQVTYDDYVNPVTGYYR